MKIKNKLGFTLLETLLAVSVVSISAFGFIAYKQDETKKIMYNSLAEDLSSIVNAVDTRLSIDGYDSSLWGKVYWNQDDIYDDLLSKQLRSVHLDDCEGEWIPKLEGEEKAELVPCNMWKERTPLNLEAEAFITTDEFLFVERFNVLLSFKNDDEFVEKFSMLRDTLRILKGNKEIENSGKHFYEFVSRLDPNTPIGIRTCIQLESQCALKGAFSRSGKKETLRSDGQNNMIDSKIGFLEDELNTPLKCVRWRKNNSDIWEKTVLEDSECGIGIYKENGYPVVVEVASDSGSFDNVLINKECKLLEWNSTTKQVEQVVNKTTPCGMTTEGNDVYQIVDNIHSENGYYKNFYANDLNSELGNINAIITENLNADFITVENDLEVKQMAFFTKLQVTGETNINNSDFEDIKTEEVSEFTDVDFLKNLDVSGDIKINQLLTTSNIFSNNEVIMDVDITSLNELKADNSLIITTNKTVNSSCSDSGAIAKTSSGQALSCTNSVWVELTSDSVPLGSISIWASKSIPDGWLECNGNTIPSQYSSLRSHLGTTTTPDLRGIFLRGLDTTGNIDNQYDGLYGEANRKLGTYQFDSFKKHRHTEKHFTGKRSARSGSSTANHSLGTYNTGATGGVETRPKNVALIYIIKAS